MARRACPLALGLGGLFVALLAPTAVAGNPGATRDFSPSGDTTPPTMTLKVASSTIREVLRKNKLPIVLTVDEPCTATGIVHLLHRTRRPSVAGAVPSKPNRYPVLARGQVKFDAGGKRRVGLKLTKRGGKLLHDAETAKIVVKFIAIDLAGNGSTVLKRAELR
jgi:hypothetical protein